MRLSLVVLSLAVLLIGLPVAGSLAQTPSRRVKKSAPAGTVKICKGISIPDGYTIVAETTSAECPGGAYILKKEGTASATAAPQSIPAMGKPAPPLTKSTPQTSRPRRVSFEDRDDAKEEEAQATGKPPALITSTKATLPAAPTQSPAPSASDSSPTEVGDGDVLRVYTNLVTVPVSVFDRQGRAVTDLGQQDFRIFENGVEQEVAYFEPTENPFTVALMLDTSASTTFRLQDIKEAAIAFARRLQPQDHVLVVTFNDQVMLLTEATNDQTVISNVINFNARTGDATRLYDAIDLVFKERLNKIKGRKAIVLFTDGVDTASYKADYESTLREVEEFDALIFPIKYDTYQDLDAATRGSITITTTSRTWPFPGNSRSSSTTYTLPSMGLPPTGFTKADYERADRYLRELAVKTGGQLYSADDPAQLAQAFSQIAEELRRQYSLGYYPKGSPIDAGDRRQIKVRVQRPDLAVRARDGYIKKSVADGAR